MNINATFDMVSGVLKGVIGLGLTLAATFLVVDLLFPGTTNIVSNVSQLISSFTGKGVVGLVALLVFVALFSRDN
jgi:hypothetical protein